MSEPLFRPQALEGQRQQWLGEVRLARPLRLWLLTLLAVLAAAVIGTWLVWGQYTRKLTAPGVLVPDRGWVRVMPPQAGLVLERRVAEGQAVQAGDVLYVLGLERSTREGGEQQRVQQALTARQQALEGGVRAQQQLAQTQVAALARRLVQLQGEREQLDAQAQLQQQRLALAQQSLARLEGLQRDSFVSPAQVQAQAEEVLRLNAQGKELERQRAALAREAEALAGQQRELPLQAQARVSELQRDIAEVGQFAVESDARRELLVRAPQTGTVGALQAEPGHWAAADAALATVLPAGAQLQAQLFAPSSALGFVREGQAVQLRVAAFPYQKFGHVGGRVTQVSRAPLQAAELAALPLPALAARPGEPLYRITVALERASVLAHGRPEPLVAGMQLDAAVLLERRRLVEWLFEPLIGLADRV